MSLKQLATFGVRFRASTSHCLVRQRERERERERGGVTDGRRKEKAKKHVKVADVFWWGHTRT